jgi:adenine-specific DNA-methyltransferase
MKVVISGSRSISVLPLSAIQSLDKIIEQGYEILVGDAPGIDLLVQQYLKSKDYKAVTVFHAYQKPRNNAGFYVVKVDGNYTDRDKFMCSIADFGLAIWDGVSKGTAQNIKRVPKTKVIQPFKVGNIKVVNKKTLSPELGYTDIYIGRPSALGNPYPMTGEHTRKVVCDLYHRYLWKQMQIAWREPDAQNSVWNELKRIALLVKSGVNVRLICFCKPLDCHGDSISKAVNWLIKENIV